MQTEIRRAFVDEVDLVSEILSEAASWLQSRKIPLWQAHEVSSAAIQDDVEAGYYFLALSDGQSVGAFKYQQEDFFIWPDAKIGEASYIHRIVVKRAFSGGELARAMLSWGAKRASAEGHQYLRLDCDAARPRLRAVYESFGFIHHSNFQAGEYFVARYQLSVKHFSTLSLD